MNGPDITDCGNGTPYQTSGRGDEDVSILILHATAGTAAFDHRIFMGWEKKHPVSIHYYVLKTGEIRYYVREEDTAWHAGRSSFQGYANWDLQVRSIGIELENLNDGNDPYPSQQYDSVLSLWRDKLIPTYNITRENCARHSDIAPVRKTDPRGFPWARFLEACYAPEMDTNTYERRYRVVYNRSVIRQGPSTGYPIVGYVDAGREFMADSIKFGEPVSGNDQWIHASSGVGFITATAVEQI